MKGNDNKKGDVESYFEELRQREHATEGPLPSNGDEEPQQVFTGRARTLGVSCSSAVKFSQLGRLVLRSRRGLSSQSCYDYDRITTMESFHRLQILVEEDRLQWTPILQIMFQFDTLWM